MTLPRLVLASASPRRTELMRAMGLEFDVVPSRVDESAIPADHPRTFALRAAYAKACDVASREEPETIVIGADTVVTRDLLLYGKPKDAEEALTMLRRLSGGPHQVITGVAVARAGSPEVLLRSDTTTVTFRELSNREILDYIATGSVFDKAGAYAIQEGAADFVAQLDGDYHNVVGLPCHLLAEMLAEVAGVRGINVPAPPARWA